MEPSQSQKPETEDALTVLQAYGPSTYELEETLFHKFRMILTARKKEGAEQLTRDKFHILLDQLSTMGYIKLISRGDRLYWMRLRSPLELEEGKELTPEKATQMIEEARAKKEAEEAGWQDRDRRYEPHAPQKPSVGAMADVILSELGRKVEPERLRAYVTKGEGDAIRRPIKEMHEALISGEDEFRLYIERNLAPRLRGQLTYFLATAGKDALLAALAVSLMMPLRASTSKE